MRMLLYDQTLEDLAGWLTNQGQQEFRARQVFEWAYQKNAASFDEMTSLARDLREVLAGSFSLGPLTATATAKTRDATKLLVALPRRGEVECVRIRMGNTDTVCVSSQVGCAVGCVFCATGQTACQRNLSHGEIISQVITLRALGGQVSNVVFMGMGEPFHNYEATVGAVRTLTDKRALGMSPSRITVSTAGVVPMIRRYAAEKLPTELTISLNAPTDALRERLMPGVARWPIAEIAAAAREYTAVTGGQPVTFSYVLIEGVNDSLDQARELAQLLRRQSHHLNIIPLNPVAHSDLQAPTRERTRAFLVHCRRFGLNASLRKSKGADIDAACGQLRGRRGTAG